MTERTDGRDNPRDVAPRYQTAAGWPNELSRRFNLTPAEWAALDHRLAVWNAIADALDAEFPRHAVVNVAKILWEGKITEAEYYNAPLAREILAEAVEGSTWVGIEGPKGLPRTRAYAQLSAAAEKLRAYIGRDLHVPTC